MITLELKKKVMLKLAEHRANFSGSDAKFAVSLGIAGAQYNRIKNGELERVLSEAKWISLARMLDVSLSDLPAWKTARTPVYDFIWEQLEFCQNWGASRLMCDVADIGKTYTAKCYREKNKNVVYVDCSQVKSKNRLIRYIAKEYGVGHTGNYGDVYEDLVFYLRQLPSPLIILDEAGDLSYEAFLELKALWNATERCCGWYMMGADGLREKVRRSIEFKKVGYAELFSRYGSRYQKASPESSEEMKEFRTVLAAMVIGANSDCKGTDVQRLIAKSECSLRRIYDEINKLRGSQK